MEAVGLVAALLLMSFFPTEYSLSAYSIDNVAMLPVAPPIKDTSYEISDSFTKSAEVA